MISISFYFELNEDVIIKYTDLSDRVCLMQIQHVLYKNKKYQGHLIHFIRNKFNESTYYYWSPDDSYNLFIYYMKSGVYSLLEVYTQFRSYLNKPNIYLDEFDTFKLISLMFSTPNLFNEIPEYKFKPCISIPAKKMKKHHIKNPIHHPKYCLYYKLYHNCSNWKIVPTKVWEGEKTFYYFQYEHKHSYIVATLSILINESQQRCGLICPDMKKLINYY